MSLAETIRENARIEGSILLQDLGIINKITEYANNLGWGYKIHATDYDTSLTVLKVALELNGFSVHIREDRSMSPRKYIQVYW